MIVSIALALFASVVAVALVQAPGRAQGDEYARASEPTQALGPTAVQTKEALESGNGKPILDKPETDLRAAQTMPHQDLDRGQALELAEAVFQPEIEEAGGIYAELEPIKFLGENAAIVPVSSLTDINSQINGSLASKHPNEPVLVESILPLSTENESGELEAVDLGLEHSEGELEPRNPLSEVGIPEQLGEGISIAGPEVEIKMPEAPEGRTATVADGEFTFYPEVAEDSDLIVEPTPQGVETMVDLRTADAPMETTYELTLPSTAVLRADGQGGAEVVDGTRTTLLIPPPTALDAAGNPVDTELTVSGDNVTVIAKPTPSTTYPALVDPTFIEEGWTASQPSNLKEWSPSTTNGSALESVPYAVFEPNYHGLGETSGVGGNSRSGDHADWDYLVPRYRQDVGTGNGEPPSTWIYGMTVEGPQFYGYGNLEPYPALIIGLYDFSKGWQGEYGIHYGNSGDLNDWSHRYWYTNTTEQAGTKAAIMNLVTYSEERPAKRRDTFLSNASVAIVDPDAPELPSLNPPVGWVRNTFTVPSYEAEDRGLGVKYVEVSFEGTGLGGNTPDFEGSFGCAGTALNPCPRTVNQASNPLQITVNQPGKASLPTGLDWVTVTASDPMGMLGIAGHKTSARILVKEDQTGPELTLSGALTEQGSLGTRRPTYPLRVQAKDGVSGAPQSGVKKVQVKVDGSPVQMPEPAEWEPNCQTENCPASTEWTLNSSEYATGPHEVEVIATDAVGNTTTKTLHIELSHPTPTLAVSGTLTEQSSLGTELPSYKLGISASARTESPPPAALPNYSSSFGSPGTTGGKFAHPGDIAIGNEGALFVVDTNNNRIEKFTAGGEFVSQFGTKGSGNGQLNRPTAIAVAANGNLWVTDSLNRRVEEFTPTGTYVAQFGTAGTGAGQFAGSGPEGIAIDYHGNIWVADTYGGRLEKFGEEGKFIRSVGTKGTGYQQLGEPTAIEVAPGGQVYVTDWEDDKVVEYGEGGAFIRQFGSQGNEPGQLQQPTGIAIDSRGDVWIGDQNNQRVEEFNQSGEYLGRFGTAGSGAGQLNLKYPIGIATDTKGDVWVTDSENNRVEKWVSSGYANPNGPTFLRSFGSYGTGNGQFDWPTGVAVANNGYFWVADVLNNRVEEFSEKGEFAGSFGGYGNGNGQFSHPLAVAVDPKNNVWVTDAENNRIEEFTEHGVWIRTVGGLKWPAGITVDSKGDVWVSDTKNNRLAEFTETGGLIRYVGGKGSGIGQMLEPYGLAVSPEGNVWVADTGNSRLDEFSSTGAFLKSVGGPGTGIGQFNVPADIDFDSEGNLWVVEMENGRVDELSSTGEFIEAFGSKGQTEGSLYRPYGIALDHSHHILIGDYEMNRVDQWSKPEPHSEVSVEIAVDGKRVEANQTRCATPTCSATREWTLQSSSLTQGSHVVVVRATDGLGNTTTKTLNVKVGDTTKPHLEVGGELSAAPDGWVQQEEGSYGFHAKATDAGFGVTALALQIDGKVVTAKEQSCASGKCSAEISTAVNVGALAAGAHNAEVKATDGAGNTTTNRWTINVDPDGAISIEELTATAKAMEASNGSPILAPAQQIPGVEGSVAGVGLTPGEGPGALGATGTYVPMQVNEEVKEGFQLYVAGLQTLAISCDEVNNPAEEACVPRAVLEAAEAEEEEKIAEGLKYPGLMPVTVKPVATISTASKQELLGGQTAGSANGAGQEADTFTRPMSDGGLSFADIRGPAAPEHYAYEMNLSPELQLRQADPQHVEVVYWKYGVTAFVITAEQAHDVIGSSVPTHLSISGPATITLTVEHRGTSPAGGGFVYPIIGGSGWQGGYFAKSFEMNEPPPVPPAAEEESWPGEGEETVIGPPEPSTPQEAGITNLAMIKKSEHNTVRRLVQHVRCERRWELPIYALRKHGQTLCGDPFTHQEASELMAFNFGIQAHIYVSPGNFVKHIGSVTNGVHCAQEFFPTHYGKGEVLLHPEYFISGASRPCEWLGESEGNGGQEVGPGHHLCLYGEWIGGEDEPNELFGTAGFIEAQYGGDGYQASWYKTTKYRCNRP